MKLPVTPSFSLQGRRALVAGGSSGIGLGCAVALAEAGAHVVVMARRKDQLAGVVAALTAAGSLLRPTRMGRALASCGSALHFPAVVHGPITFALWNRVKRLIWGQHTAPRTPAPNGAAAAAPPAAAPRPSSPSAAAAAAAVTADGAVAQAAATSPFKKRRAGQT